MYRLIPIENKNLLTLKKKLDEYQKEANPFLDQLDVHTKELDPFFTQLRELEEKKNDLRKEMTPIKEKYDEVIAEIEKIEQKAQLVKDKMKPIVDTFVADKLEQFERPAEIIERNGEMLIKVIDEVEEYKERLITKGLQEAVDKK
jgi:chromosome segregation ATPase